MLQVEKRDGRREGWDSLKIVVAVTKACRTVQSLTEEEASDIANRVAEKVRTEFLTSVDPVPVSKVHDSVEVHLMGYSPEAAKAYILFRSKRDSERPSESFDDSALSDYIHPAKYGRWFSELGRRETFDETVYRVFNMHYRQIEQIRLPEVYETVRNEANLDTSLVFEPYDEPDIDRVKITDLDIVRLKINPLTQSVSRVLLRDLLDQAYEGVRQKRFLPSMRSMQFAGEKIRQHNAAIYNCSYTYVDRPRVFAETMYLLLCGCGVGFSVQKHHVAQLPELGVVDKKKKVKHFLVPDTIEGWADAVHELVLAAVGGYYVEFSYAGIRPEGSPLVTSGGKAPGHLPLKRTLEKIREILDEAAGRRLRPIECHDIMCWIAMSVLAGGIRRSSLISLFSEDDEEMMVCKTPQHFAFGGKNDQRQMANNSPVCLRATVTAEKIAELVDTARSSGDPGLYMAVSSEHGCNPCGEIGMEPRLFDDESLAYDVVGSAAWGADLGRTGFSFCNLVEINGAVQKSKEELVETARLASIVATIQATYTKFPYLGPVTEHIAKRDALIGVSITGMADNPKVCFDPQALREAAEQVVKTNREVACLLGIRSAARCTTVKPGGTAPLELGGVASGISPHWAPRFFRRVTANPHEPVALFFQSKNPHAVDVKQNGDLSLVFPKKAPEGSLTWDDVDAVQFLEMVRTVYENWIVPGSQDPKRSVGLTHNVSCTVVLREDEIPAVKAWIWENRERICAVSFMLRYNDHLIPWCPLMAVRDEVDEARWKALVGTWKKVDYREMIEDSDGTLHVSNNAACAGGACEI